MVMFLYRVLIIFQPHFVVRLEWSNLKECSVLLNTQNHQTHQILTKSKVNKAYKASVVNHANADLIVKATAYHYILIYFTFFLQWHKKHIQLCQNDY